VRKRKFDEISKKSDYVRESNTQLFIDRYVPRKMGELVINSKKVKEFQEFIESPTSRILFLQGPHGSGKHSLIRAYWEEHKLELTKFKYSHNSNFDDLMGQKEYRGAMKGVAEFESLINFVREGWKRIPQRTKKSKFCTNSHDSLQTSLGAMSLKDSEKKMPTFKWRIAVVDGLPDIVKQKMDIGKDCKFQLQELLKQIISQKEKTSPIVFVFSELKETTKVFLDNIFSEKILSGYPNVVKRIELNPITEKAITSVLMKIIDDRGIQIRKDEVQEIVFSWSKDLAHALQMLQFQSSNKMGFEMNGSHSNGKMKRAKKGYQK
jgi:DNA polymerase III delta prime subunit